jgi:hypothetical protein
MSPVKHVFIIGSMLELSACSKEDPCDENPNLIICRGDDAETAGSQESGDSGETGKPDPEPDGCTPLMDDQVGHTYECNGSGNGWLQLSIYPIGAQDPECLSWGDQPKPKHPTGDDCVAIDLGSLPNNVPGPGACCTEQALPDSIIDQCNDDCGHAACKLAIEKLRDAALSLSTKGAKGTVRLDLFYLANLLEMPDPFGKCVEQVTSAGGKLTSVELGPGSSNKHDPGHIESAMLNLQCALDEIEPYTYVGNICEAPPNVPILEHESYMAGIAPAGAVMIVGPDSEVTANLYDISFAFTERRYHSGSVEIQLDDFSARSSTAAYDSFEVTQPSMRLVAPASGSMTGETGEIITFPPGSLRMEVTAALTSNGDPLFDGQRMSGEYLNSDSATAIRTEDDKFSFLEATFEAGGYRFVLSTEPGSFQPR